MFGCGWLPSSGSLEEPRVWRDKELPALGVGGARSRCGFSRGKAAGPQLHSLLLPSGKIWVLQGMGLQRPPVGVIWSSLAQFADA